VRVKVYRYLFRGEEIVNPAMVPRMLSQVDIGFVPNLPGAGLLLARKQLRAEALIYIYKTTHFSTRWDLDGFETIQRSDGDARCAW